MKTIEVCELPERINEILRLIEKGEIIALVADGNVIAHVIPTHTSEESTQKDSAAWENLNRIASELELYSPKGVDSVEIVRDVRRDWSRTERLAAEIGSYLPEKVDINDIMRDIRGD